MTQPDLTTQVGSRSLANPVMTASGTAGHGTELGRYVDLSSLGAHVVKSLSAFPWDGNRAPRVHVAGDGMLNAIGLQGPGLERWIADELPTLAGIPLVVSIWGRSVDDYRRAAELLAPIADQLVAVEVNLSCPNLEGRRGIFAHDAALSAEVIRATAACVAPRWAKLSANTDRIVDVAAAVVDAGADAVTLINTLLGMVIDPVTRRPLLGAAAGHGHGGGYSGRPVHPVAVRTVYDVHAALPHLPIIGVGGVSNGWSAIELILAGASAVQVGTASFADPRAAARVLDGVRAWLASNGVERLSDLVGAAHPSA